MRTAGDVTDVGTILTEEKVYANPFFPVISRIIRRTDGAVREPQLLWDRGGKEFTIAVATDRERRYILVEEPKYGQMRLMISAPTGGVKKGEDPLAAAKRELFEETGYVSDYWNTSDVAPVCDFADKSDGGIHWIYYAAMARKQREPREQTQKIVLATKEQILRELIPSGRIPAMSIAALLIRIHM